MLHCNIFSLIGWAHTQNDPCSPLSDVASLQVAVFPPCVSRAPGPVSVLTRDGHLVSD